MLSRCPLAQGKKYNVPVFGAWQGTRPHGRLKDEQDNEEDGNDENDEQISSGEARLHDLVKNDDEIPGDLTQDFTEFARSNVITKLVPPPSSFGGASLLDARNEEGLTGGDTSSDCCGGRYKSLSAKDCSSQKNAVFASDSELTLKSRPPSSQANALEDSSSLPLPALLNLYMGGSLMTELQMQRLLAELKDVVEKLENSLTGREQSAAASDGVEMKDRVTSWTSESAVRGVDLQPGGKPVERSASCMDDYAGEQMTDSLRGDAAVSSERFALQAGNQRAQEGNEHTFVARRSGRKASPMKKPLLRHLDKGGSGFGAFTFDRPSEMARNGSDVPKLLD